MFLRQINHLMILEQYFFVSEIPISRLFQLVDDDPNLQLSFEVFLMFV